MAGVEWECSFPGAEGLVGGGGEAIFLGGGQFSRGKFRGGGGGGGVRGRVWGQFSRGQFSWYLKTKQHDLYVKSLVGDVKANSRDFYMYSNSQKKKTSKVFHP